MNQIQKIHLHQQSRELELVIEGAGARLSAEYLRVNSPSAEVQGHGPGQAVLVSGKKNVGISRIEPVGNYGLRLFFDDAHNSGIYTWSYLLELVEQREQKWSHYLHALEAAGQHRDPNVTVIQFP